jgi:glycine betaine/proline transport system ATP-binding protein
VNGSGKLLGIILRVSVLAGLMSEAGGNGAERSAAD